MTAQIPEELRFEGRLRAMFTEPLNDYFAQRGIEPEFAITSSALWRGYIGTWSIRRGQLFLAKLEGTLSDGAEATVQTFFPGHPEGVFADWFSGELRIPQGKRLEYVHAGFASRYEEDLILTIERGVLFGRQVRPND